ncbi:MAG: hypothetical protein K0R57_861 [Paenibacillaceae bacterium]|jgi:putative intracellular protease/amidase|nr:hypothetical protein [Paenibacillaceae bacterium]
MGKVLCFISDSFADFEITLVFHKLRNVGRKEVVTVGYSRDAVTSESGLLYLPHATVREAIGWTDVEGLIIPGGPIRPQQPELTELIRKLDREQIMLAAICNGPQYLGRAGILDTAAYTTSCSPDKMRELGSDNPFPAANYVEERVVADRHIITGKGRAFVDFSFAIFEYLDIYRGRYPEQAKLYQDIVNN